MKDLLNFLRVSIVGHFRSYAILLKQESEPVSGVAAPTGDDHYVIPETVKEDEVAAFASEEDLLIYSHFYDKGKDKAGGELAALKAVAEKANAELKTIRSKGVTSSISEYERLDKLVTEITAALGEKTDH